MVQAKVLKLLRDLQDNFNFTYVFITHDLGVVRNMSNRMIVLKDGKIVETGKTSNIFLNPQSEYTKNLIRSIPVVSEQEENIKP